MSKFFPWFYINQLQAMQRNWPIWTIQQQIFEYIFLALPSAAMLKLARGYMQHKCEYSPKQR